MHAMADFKKETMAEESVSVGKIVNSRACTTNIGQPALGERMVGLEDGSGRIERAALRVEEAIA